MFVKVCGLSTPESVREAVAAGADAVGFVLTASPRVVSPSQASALLAEVPERVLPIGVFRDEPVVDAVAIARAAGRATRLNRWRSSALPTLNLNRGATAVG